MEGEEERQLKQTMEDEKRNNKSSVVIRIPTHEEVFEISQPKPPPSLFRPSSSFSEAFSFLKNTEFYTAPPEPPQPSLRADNDTSSQSQIAQAEAPPSSSSSATAAVGGGGGISASVPSSSSPHVSVQNRNAILVSHRQKGNPLLKHIRNVRWMFADVVCDYLLGQNSCALYLSLRYHLLHPDYLYYRIRELQKNFKLRVVLCHVDVEDVVKPLLEVTRTALLHDCTLLCGWSLEECGRYLETIKVYENKPADIIQGQTDTDYLSRLHHSLTAVRRVNKTDVVTLGSNFGSLSRIMDASMEDLARCPGIGEHKVRRLYETFHEPFKRSAFSRPTAVPEAPVQDAAAPSSIDNDVEAAEECIATKQKKKDPDLIMKSALSAAFAKYSDKICKKKEEIVDHNDEDFDVASSNEKPRKRKPNEEAAS
ncbi:DNA excision repair protein ERCC-1 [Macadamia integrifolia]|uniref:DNA excision repair protein ERCC-1 n=1 Tax=Macadamia integrifolia TaxID=60698 RepID=UPI001C4F568E|nr:DNA excision repair protein ERCC-1 [Macadamia integrifolia]